MSKRPTSPRQLQANTANAKLSTGPRTPEGKSVSSQTGCKFKTGSIDRLIAGTLFKDEDESGLRVLIEQFTAEFRPQTLNEFGIVEEMASVRWEIGRLLIAKRDIVARLAVDQEGPTEAAKVSRALEVAYSSKGSLGISAINRSPHWRS